MPDFMYDEFARPPLPEYSYTTLENLRASGSPEDLTAQDLQERMVQLLSSIYTPDSESIVIGTEHLGPVVIPHVAFLPSDKDVPYTLHISQDPPQPDTGIHALHGFQYHLADKDFALYVDYPDNPLHPQFDSGAIAAHTFKSSGNASEDAQHMQMVFGNTIHPDVAIDIMESDQIGLRILFPHSFHAPTVYGFPIRGIFLPSPRPSKELHEPKLEGPVLFVIDKMSSLKPRIP